MTKKLSKKVKKRPRTIFAYIEDLMQGMPWLVQGLPSKAVGYVFFLFSLGLIYVFNTYHFERNIRVLIQKNK